ncbi:hypothetical protein COEREDRAFT_84344 [Coemansia reversa NRRL 1564]|uniref:Uncharacterized protein n=1 Tax=Coemansia reversa (strain ATCC 12441 / NRRL 1564) TaxID=763665 RepID=A0A2G5BL50_COERN|nr:hypothetical protein COEREDRAFT_84344 [Coemansia reversa NRRL 1564]|eukprot:PIA19730.1 hypothetical protein COEREDRAFT_84344 [Coemansia reversa NRRL 1564]
MNIYDSGKIKYTVAVFYKPGENPAIARCEEELTYDGIVSKINEGAPEIKEAGIEQGFLYGDGYSRKGWMSDGNVVALASQNPWSSDFDSADQTLWEGKGVIDASRILGMRFSQSKVFHFYCHPICRRLEVLDDAYKLVNRVVDPNNSGEDDKTIAHRKIMVYNKAIENIDGLIKDEGPSEAGKEKLKEIKKEFESKH